MRERRSTDGNSKDDNEKHEQPRSSTRRIITRSDEMARAPSKLNIAPDIGEFQPRGTRGSSLMAHGSIVDRSVHVWRIGKMEVICGRPKSAQTYCRVLAVTSHA